jgi:hypothetical protein
MLEGRREEGRSREGSAEGREGWPGPREEARMSWVVTRVLAAAREG